MGTGGRGALTALRGRHRQRIVELLGRGPASRSELARRTGLSKTTVSSLVAELVDGGLVEQRGVAPAPAARGRGRPPVLFGLAAPRGWVVGVDFDHDRLRVAYADEEGDTFAEREVEIDVAASSTAAIDAAAAMVADILGQAATDRTPVLGVVMGIPGPLDRSTGTVGSSVMLPGWQDVAPGPELARRIGVPVEVENDANLAALGEVRSGAGRGLEDLVSVKVGTGIGAGLLLGGRIYRGATGLAGEIGHVHVQDNGPVCRCGSRGCLETLVTVPRLVESLQAAHARPLNREDLVTLACEGDHGALRVLTDAGRTIGRVLVDLCTNLNPAAVIVCGDLGDALSPVVAGVRESIDRYGQPRAAAAVQVRRGALGSRAVVLGALALALERGPASVALDEEGMTKRLSF